MAEFNDKDLENMTIDEINEMFKDVIETPEPLIATICYLPGGPGSKIYGSAR